MESTNDPDFPYPKIRIKTECFDYITDMTAFVLEPSEIATCTEFYKKKLQKFLIIVVSRCSTIFGYCFDTLEHPLERIPLYTISEAHKNRILCVRSLKPSFVEQRNLNISMDFCFITGGLEPELKIWDAISGNFLKTISFTHGYIVDCLVFQLGTQNELYDVSAISHNQMNKKQIVQNLVISVGPVKYLSLVDTLSGEVQDIPTRGVNSINSVEAIGIFNKNNNKNRYFLFATVDKGCYLNVWNVEKKKKQILCRNIAKIELLMYLILGLTSFSTSADPYKRKYIMAAGGLRGDIFQHKFYIAIVDWKKSLILRSFFAHSNWINTLRCLPVKVKGKSRDYLISGSADERMCFWDCSTGCLKKEYKGQGDRVVMHGMRLFHYEEKQEKKYFIVSGGCDNEKNFHFKVWS